jgi:hypothetical protein
VHELPAKRGYQECTEGSAMRRAAKIDAVQPEIVEALRAVGATVYYIKEPVDLLVGYRGRTVVLECKSKNGTLRPSQEKFFAEFEGEAYIVQTVSQALKAIGACK